MEAVIKFLYTLLKYRNIPLSLLFILYLFLVQPILIEHLAQIREYEQPNRTLGIFFLALQFVELLALYLKRPAIMRYTLPDSKDFNKTGHILIFIFIPILHLGMAAFLYIIAAQIGGFQPSDNAPFWAQMVFVLGMFVIIAKEGLLLSTWFTPFDQKLRQKVTEKIRLNPEMTLSMALLDFLGDILLLVFAALGYTALWGFIASGSPISNGDFWHLAMQYFGVLLFYFMSVIPLRGMYYMFFPFLNLNKRQVISEWIGLIASFIAAAASVPVR